MPHAPSPASAGQCWWDATQGLGVCGDFLGGTGVEGAWLSARALASALLQGPPIAAAASAASLADHPALPVTA